MTVIDNPRAIQAYQLLVWRSCLKLEQKGLRHSGGAIRPRIAKSLDLKSTATRETFIAAIEQQLHDLGHPDF